MRCTQCGRLGEHRERHLHFDCSTSTRAFGVRRAQSPCLLSDGLHNHALAPEPPKPSRQERFLFRCLAFVDPDFLTAASLSIYACFFSATLAHPLSQPAPVSAGAVQPGTPTAAYAWSLMHYRRAGEALRAGLCLLLCLAGA